jgi:hypothetical protein
MAGCVVARKLLCASSQLAAAPEPWATLYLAEYATETASEMLIEAVEAAPSGQERIMAGRGTVGRPSGVEAVAEELYGLPLGRFTPARNERAKQARAAGDSEAAVAIGKLAKPNKVAWLANQLAREDADEIRALLELGESMRQATASLAAEQLRQASRQQHQIIYALVQQARSLASAAGQAVSEDTARGLGDTLHAALADEQAARQLSQGRLTSGLSRSGFPGIDASAASPPARSTAAGRRAQPGRPPAGQQAPGGQAPGRQAAGRQIPGRQAPGRQAAAGTAAARRREQVTRARQDEADARSRTAKADRARENAQATLGLAEDAARAAADNVGRLQAELDAALEARTSADRARRQARKDADRADRAARHAERRLADATARRLDVER